MPQFFLHKLKTRSNTMELHVLARFSQYHKGDYFSADDLASKLTRELESVPSGNAMKSRHSYRIVTDEETQTVDLWKLDAYGDNTRHVVRFSTEPKLNGK